MKRLFYTQTPIALAVAIAVAAAVGCRAQEQPAPPPATVTAPPPAVNTAPPPAVNTAPPPAVNTAPPPAVNTAPPPATDTALPPNIAPGSPLADVVKMIQAGVDPSTIKTYVANVQNLFNLDADTIIYLKDLGASSDVINAMMDRDKALYASTVTPPQPPPQPPPPQTAEPPPVPPVDTSTPETEPPPTDVTVNYFYDTLTPYGAWVDVDGYGRCWRPTVVVYNSGWCPYGDGGHWVDTDYGWYWDSDYSWGVTFHYGRWFRSPSFGWCWYPDTVWAPSWVVWRSSDAYCGWAPLPPFAVFRPGIGFFYRGIGVDMNFDFGLAPDCFVFCPPTHFCDPRPHSFFVDRAHVTQVFHQTTIINNYTVNNTTIVNRGIQPERIASVTHHPIQPIHVGSLPNAGRQGWRGDGFDRTMHPTPGNHYPPGNNNPGHGFTTVNGGNGVGNGQQLRHGPEPYNNPGAPATTTARRDPSVSGSQPVHSQGQPPQLGNGSYGQPQTYVHQPAQQPQQPGHVTQPYYQWQQPQQYQQPARLANPQQPQQYQYQQPARPANPYPEASRVNPQYPQYQQNQAQQNQWPQNRNAGTAFPDPAQQHGAGQLQQREPVPAEQPRPNYNESQPSQPHYSQPPPAQPAPQGQGQPQYNNNGNGNGGGNRQNH